MATEILKSQNLFVNEDRTAFTRVYLANSGEMDTSGKLVASREEWRRSITLCSMLCNEADIQQRFSLGSAAFNEYKKAWTNKKRLMVYEALVVLVLLCTYSYISNSAVISYNRTLGIFVPSSRRDHIMQ